MRALSYQHARMRAQIEGLDRRLLALLLEPTQARAALCPVSPTTILDLPPELLRAVAGKLDADDALAAALSCRSLRDALDGARRLPCSTTVGSLFSSLVRLLWGVSCGAPLRRTEASYCVRAAGLGDLLMLQWLRARGFPWETLGQLDAPFGCPRHDWAYGVCVHAAFGGHLAVLQWARANGCSWDERTCAAAWLGGHFHVLRWARANGCPCNIWACLEESLETRDGRELIVMRVCSRADRCLCTQGSP